MALCVHNCQVSRACAEQPGAEQCYTSSPQQNAPGARPQHSENTKQYKPALAFNKTVHLLRLRKVCEQPFTVKQTQLVRGGIKQHDRSGFPKGLL